MNHLLWPSGLGLNPSHDSSHDPPCLRKMAAFRMELKTEYIYISIVAGVFKVKHGSYIVVLGAKLGRGNNHRV